MRKLPFLAFASVAVLAGTAIAASPKSHVMNVPLPDGSLAHIEYVGDVAPKVTVSPRMSAEAAGPWATSFPSFAGFDKMIQEMNRQSEEMMRRAQQITRQPSAAAPYVASYGNLPAGETSTTVISYSNGASTCTRTTQIVSQGSGKPPKVTSNLSGQCSSAAPPSNVRSNPT